MNENIKSIYKYKTKQIQGNFVEVHFALLKIWTPWMERQCKGSTLAYIVIQTYINRDINNDLFGYAWPTYKELKYIMAIESDKKIWQIMNFLVKHKFIDRMKIGRKYYFRVNPLPEFFDEVLRLQDDMRVKSIIKKQKKDERFKTLREQLANTMPIDEDIIMNNKKKEAL